MSHTWSLVCPETKKGVWIGQGNLEMTIFYSKEDKTMETLRVFLNAHHGKDLRLVCSASDEWLEYEEFTQEVGDESINDWKSKIYHGQST